MVNMILDLLYYDKIYIYGKELEQSKYQFLLKKGKPINKEVGYQVIETSCDEIIPVVMCSTIIR